MKMNTKLMLTLTFMLAGTSCNDADIVVEQSRVNNDVSIVNTRQVNLTPDEMLHEAQSDMDNMLIDQIIYRDSMYILNLDVEEAVDLNIPDSLYRVYVRLVENLNKTK